MFTAASVRFNALFDPVGRNVSGDDRVSPMQIPLLRYLLSEDESDDGKKACKFAQTVLNFMAMASEGKNPITERQCQVLISEEIVIEALRSLSWAKSAVSKVRTPSKYQMNIGDVRTCCGLQRHIQVVSCATGLSCC